MATTYEVRGPDGVIHQFSGPDDAAPDQVLAAAQAQFGASTAPPFEVPKLAKSARPKGTQPATAFAMGAARGAFNLPGMATSAIDAVAGTNLNEDYDQYRQQVAADNPSASFAGELTGGFLPAVAAGIPGVMARGAAAIPKGAAILRAMTPVVGETAKNVGRYFLPAAAGAGVQSLTEGAGPQEAAVRAGIGGAAGGLIGAGVAGLARGLQNFAGLVDEGGQGAARDANAVRYLAGVLRQDPEAIAAELTRLEAAAGRPFSPSEALSALGAANLRKSAEILRPVGDAVRAREATVTAERPGTMAGKVLRGGGVDTASALTRRAAKAMNDARKVFQNESAPLTQEQAANFLDPDAAGYLTRRVKLRLRDIYDNGGGTLSISDLDGIRKAFGDAGKPGLNHALFDLSRQAREIAEGHSAAYRQGMADRGALLNTRDGFKAGNKEIDPATFEDDLAIAASETPEFAGGRATGTRTRLVTEAQGGEGAALRLAERLAEPSGVRSATLGALPEREVAGLQALGAAETQSADRLRQIVPRVAPGNPQAEAATQTGLETGLTAGGKVLSGFGVHAVLRALKNIRHIAVSEGTAQRVGELLTEPGRAQDLVRLLREEGMNGQEIRKFMQLVSAGAGMATGGSADAGR